MLALLLAVLPTLLWDGEPGTAPVLKQSGITEIAVPVPQEAAWKASGLKVIPVDPARLEKLPPPGVNYRTDVATATAAPWVDSNAWRFLRKPDRKYLYEVERKLLPLAMAEAYANGGEAYFRLQEADLEEFSRTLSFLRGLKNSSLEPLANIAVVDSESPLFGEMLNLLSRKNLLYRVVDEPVTGYDLLVHLGTKEYPTASARDPYSFAVDLRYKLTDEKRLLRLYGSEVVLGRLEGSPSQMRLHLVNYGGRNVPGLRVRVLGRFSKGDFSALGLPGSELRDYVQTEGATEFTVPELGPYAVVDLFR